METQEKSYGQDFSASINFYIAGDKYLSTEGYTTRLPNGFENTPSLIAMGSELENTFRLVKGGMLSFWQAAIAAARVLRTNRINNINKRTQDSLIEAKT